MWMCWGRELGGLWKVEDIDVRWRFWLAIGAAHGVLRYGILIIILVSVLGEGVFY